MTHAKGTVLVIDDNAHNLDIAKELLEFSGYCVLTADNTHDGIDLMRRHSVDAVLLDILMPGTDGYDAAMMIRTDAQLKHVPIIGYTALASEENQNKVLACGCQAVITKPIDMNVFYETIESVLQSRGVGSGSC
jgi:CheY-like chemotaxis protein